tara:strand:+ start:11503 stop:12105 length:603 start_codon:yes stop_codon:yes gene_type:complete
MDIILQTLGVLAQAAGAALLYLHWRRQRGLGGITLAAGWALILIGVSPWLPGVSLERGLALAALAPMFVGLLLSAPGGLEDLRRAARDRPARRRTVRDVTAPAGESPSPGSLSRNAARWVGSLIIVPLCAIAAMAAWQAFSPGPDVNRASFSILALMIVWIAALLWLLASAKPWRVALITAFGTSALGGSVFLLSAGGPT